MKIKNKIFIFLILFFSPALASAQSVTVNEIMYDPPGTDTGHEWIEIYNSGSESVDLSAWKFFEEGTNHGLASFQGGTDLDADTYAIIVSDGTKFVEDFPSYSGMIIDSSWSSFNNTGENLALKDSGGNIVDSVDYVGGSAGAGDGNSLQNISGSWQGGEPTPGAENEAGGNNENNVTTGTNPKVEITEEITPLQNVKISVTTDPRAIVGIPFKFYVRVYDDKGFESLVGKFIWNFGDGIKQEIKDGTEVTHTYKYPGKYIVYLQYSKRSHLDNFVPDETVKLTINVIEAGLKIVSIKSDGAIEIKNETDSDRDISGWGIVSAGQIFIFPDQSSVSAKSSIFIGRDVHQIQGLTNYSKVGLYLSTGGLYYLYSGPTASIQAPTVPISKIESVEEKVAEDELPAEIEIEEETIQPEVLGEIIEDIDSSVVLTNVSEDGVNINPKIFIGSFALFCLIILFVFRHLNKKVSTKVEADEYKILS